MNPTPTDLQTLIGKTFRAARREKGWTQTHVADEVGISVEFYTRVEQGRALPGLKSMIRLAQVLDTGLDFLTTGESEAQPSPAETDALMDQLVERITSSPGTRRLVSVIIDELERRGSFSRKQDEPEH